MAYGFAGGLAEGIQQGAVLGMMLRKAKQEEGFKKAMSDAYANSFDKQGIDVINDTPDGTRSSVITTQDPSGSESGFTSAQPTTMGLSKEFQPTNVGEGGAGLAEAVKGGSYGVDNTQGLGAIPAEARNPDAAVRKTFNQDTFNQKTIGALAEYYPEKVSAFTNQMERTRLARRADERAEKAMLDQFETSKLERERAQAELDRYKSLGPLQKRKYEAEIQAAELAVGQSEIDMLKGVAGRLYDLTGVTDPTESDLNMIKNFLTKEKGALEELTGGKIQAPKSVTYKDGAYTITGEKGGVVSFTRDQMRRASGMKPTYTYRVAKGPNDAERLYRMGSDGSVEVLNGVTPSDLAAMPLTDDDLIRMEDWKLQGLMEKFDIKPGSFEGFFRMSPMSKKEKIALLREEAGVTNFTHADLLGIEKPQPQPQPQQKPKTKETEPKERPGRAAGDPKVQQGLGDVTTGAPEAGLAAATQPAGGRSMRGGASAREQARRASERLDVTRATRDSLQGKLDNMMAADGSITEKQAQELEQWYLDNGQDLNWLEQDQFENMLSQFDARRKRGVKLMIPATMR